MTKWRWNHQTGESYEVDDSAPPPRKLFQVMASREAYHSPVTGEKVYGRQGRSKDLSIHGCVDYADVPSRERLEKQRDAEHTKSIEETVNDVARSI